MKKEIKILAIESSCDETAASIIADDGNSLHILSNIIASQIDIHKQYGGVIPEIAAREHCRNIIPVVNSALKEAGLSGSNATQELQAIAVTTGPGLITSLMVGVETARSLSYAWKLPLISVNHIAGHIYANWLNNQSIQFPCLVMTVSGGHNLLVLMTDHLKYKIVGDTKDDAAGEAFDKAAKILGLGYPGGPAIAKAAQIDEQFKVKLPRPMLHSGDFNFSFSGLKTALLYQVQKDKAAKNHTNAYAEEFEQAVTDIITTKTLQAAKKYKTKTIMLAGGVSANKRLRAFLTAKALGQGLPVIIAPLPYTTDNAAMIASAAIFQYHAGQFTPWHKLKANPNLKLK